jgi:hypothetical protein
VTDIAFKAARNRSIPSRGLHADHIRTRGSGRELRGGRSRNLDKAPRGAGASDGADVALEPTIARMMTYTATLADMRSSDQDDQETDEA